MNSSVLTNRQKFCIRLPKWVFAKVANRLKVTSFGDPQHQETTRKTQRSWVWNQFKPEFFEALSRNCFCWVHDWADFFSCYKNWQSRNRLIRSEIKRLNCLIILCLITEHASQRFTVLFKKKTISSLTSWKFMFSPTSMALLTKLWCVNVTPLECPVVPCRINTQTMSCLVTWFWKLKNLVFSNYNQYSILRISQRNHFV